MEWMNVQDMDERWMMSLGFLVFSSHPSADSVIESPVFERHSKSICCRILQVSEFCCCLLRIRGGVCRRHIWTISFMFIQLKNLPLQLPFLQSSGVWGPWNGINKWPCSIHFCEFCFLFTVNSHPCSNLLHFEFFLYYVCPCFLRSMRSTNRTACF